MRGGGKASRRRFALVALSGVCALLAGCQTFSGKPARLYSIAEEVANARDTLPTIAANYAATKLDVDRIGYRNEYIALRMYIIDAEFTEFETALTRERDEFGFGTALVTQGLTTAGAVFTPANTVRTLSALAGGVNASRGFYDSELLIGKTIQIVQSQMEAKRDEVAARIISKVGYSSITYPLSAALHDLEDYYRAGTLTEGLIKASADAGEAAKNASTVKEAVMTLQGGTFQRSDAGMQLVQRYLSPGDPKVAKARATTLAGCLSKLGFPGAPAIYAVDPSSAGVRLLMIRCASDAKDPMK